MAKRFDAIAKLQEIANRPGVTIPWDRITINRWRPDTCPRPPCTIEQWFDDDDPGTVLWANSVAQCSAHESANLDEALWATVRGENLRKNGSISAARGIALIDADTEIAWAFDDAARVIDGQERALSITVPGINQQQANQIQAAIDIRFGPGVVNVERG